MVNFWIQFQEFSAEAGMGGTEMKGMGRGEEFDKELNVTQNKNKSIYQ